METLTPLFDAILDKVSPDLTVYTDDEAVDPLPLPEELEPELEELLPDELDEPEALTLNTFPG
ncbi:hypothetical protein GCM10027286_00020 [Virgibacillus ainsalahensis]